VTCDSGGSMTSSVAMKLKTFCAESPKTEHSSCELGSPMNTTPIPRSLPSRSGTDNAHLMKLWLYVICLLYSQQYYNLGCISPCILFIQIDARSSLFLR